MELTSYIIIGVAVSAIVQFLKKKYGTESNQTMVIVIGLSILAGSLYFFIKDSGYFENILTILAFAGATYTYVLKKFED